MAMTSEVICSVNDIDIDVVCCEDVGNVSMNCFCIRARDGQWIKVRLVFVLTNGHGYVVVGHLQEARTNNEMRGMNLRSATMVDGHASGNR